MSSNHSFLRQASWLQCASGLGLWLAATVPCSALAQDASAPSPAPSVAPIASPTLANYQQAFQAVQSACPVPTPAAASSGSTSEGEHGRRGRSRGQSTYSRAQVQTYVTCADPVLQAQGINQSYPQAYREANRLARQYCVQQSSTSPAGVPSSTPVGTSPSTPGNKWQQIQACAQSQVAGVLPLPEERGGHERGRDEDRHRGRRGDGGGHGANAPGSASAPPQNLSSEITQQCPGAVNSDGSINDSALSACIEAQAGSGAGTPTSTSGAAGAGTSSPAGSGSAN